MQTPTTVNAVARGADALAELRAEMYPRKLIGLTINGPKGSRAEVFIGQVVATNRIDQTARGESNSADYANPRSIPAGMPASVVWPKMAAKATEANATFITDRGA